MTQNGGVTCPNQASDNGENGAKGGEVDTMPEVKVKQRHIWKGNQLLYTGLQHTIIRITP